MLAGILFAVAPPQVQIDWTAPEQCPARAAVESRTLEALGPNPQPTSAVHATGVVTQTADGRFALALTIKSDSGEGTRELEGADCQQLSDAAALIVAIAVDPRVLERATSEPSVPVPIQVPKAPEPVPQPEPKPDLDPEPIPDPAPAPIPAPPPSRLTLDLGVTGGAGFAILPAPTADLAVNLALSGALWRAELGADYWTPVERQSSTNELIGGRYQLWAIGARGCFAPHVGDVEIPLCAGFDVGAMHARGTGNLVPNSSAAIWAAFAGGAGVLYRFQALQRRFGLILRVEGLGALTRPKFGTEQSGLVYRTPAGGARVLAGLVVRLR